MMSVNETYYGNHFTVYIKLKPLCGTPSTHTGLFVNYISIKWEKYLTVC